MKHARSGLEWPGRRRIARAVALACVLAVAPAGAVPVSRTITVDGALDDWVPVLTNTANTTWDGDASDPTCLSSSDADCPVSRRHRDLATFAWTWDADNWYFMVDHQAAADIDRYVYVYIDADRDGRMRDEEPVVVLRLRDDAGRMDLDLDDYQQLLPVFGDWLVDLAGMADGHRLPGDVGGNKRQLAQDVGILPGATACEAAVPWVELGLSPGAAFDFHVSSARSDDLPYDVRDNLGAANGGVGTTAWIGLAVEAPLSVAAAPGSTVDLQHQVSNLGNEQAVVTFAAVSSTGEAMSWLCDADGDGEPETLLAHDAQGDGLFTLPGDNIYPGGDSDGDGRPDLGPLAPGEQALLVLRREIDLAAAGLLEELDLRVWEPDKAVEQVTLTDVIAVGDVVLRADEVRQATPGDFAWFPHRLDNTTGTDQTVSFGTFSSLGWPMELFLDVVGVGDPADAVPLPDTDGDGSPDLDVGATSGRHLLARVEVPLGTSIGQGDQAFVQARLGAASAGVVRDRAIAEEALRLRPNHRLVDQDARHAGPGGAVWFPHRIDNARSALTSVQVSASSDLGWPVELWSDPNGNGLPDDAVLLADPTLDVAPNGGSARLFARVTIPPGVSVGETSRITVTGTAQDDPAVIAQAEDDAVVSLIRVFDDPSLVLNVSRVEPCRLVYAQASGLPPLSADARITWRTPDGTPVRVLDASTDGNGEATDTLTLSRGDPLGTWSVEIELFDGMAWVLQDVAEFRVDDGHAAEQPILGAATLTLAGDLLSAEASVRSTVSDGPQSATLLWRVLPSDRSSLLQADGSFVAFDGSSFTRMEVVELAALDEKRLTLAIAGVVHPSEGDYVVELYTDTACGGEPSLVGAVGYQSLDDDDRDGLRRDDELAAGTDPDDADSDDDGLLDGEDGLGDSDGDGSLDALDCDSDDDGLPDGLEAGLITASADTDLAAGCFVIDADPGTITDPDDPDSDGGGVSDGVEDADADGRVDLSETDPQLAADDLDPCDPSPPREVQVLRVARQGSAGARVSWVPLPPGDPCLSYALLVSEDLPNFLDLATGLDVTLHDDDQPAASGSLRSYRIVADSLLSGRGP